MQYAPDAAKLIGSKVILNPTHPGGFAASPGERRDAYVLFDDGCLYGFMSLPLLLHSSDTRARLRSALQQAEEVT